MKLYSCVLVKKMGFPIYINSPLELSCDTNLTIILFEKYDNRH